MLSSLDRPTLDLGRTNRDSGLSSEEAAQRLAHTGPNDLHAGSRAAGVIELLHQLANPLVLILLAASFVSAYLHERTNALVIVTIVVLSVGLEYIQTDRSRRAAHRLRSQVALTCTVLRDGRWQEISRNAVVPGDLIRLSAGDLVPADARVRESRDLHVQQAALTGESLPVEKIAAPDGNLAKVQLSEPSAVFLGSSVVSGLATVQVVATGTTTLFGQIAEKITSRPPETEFDRGMRQFSAMILKVVFILVLFVFLASALRHRDPLDSLLFAVALAVGLTPEFLPMIVTVTLARGAVRMAHKHVIVKHLAALQNFGSMDVLCSDKTGTLTRGEMVLERTVDPHGHSSERPRELAVVNSSLESGIKSPLDTAVLQHKSTHADACEKLDEIPFDFERRMVSVVVQNGDDRLLITKGAPESLLPRCTLQEIAAGQQPLNDAERERAQETFAQLSDQGFRILAVAWRAVPAQNAYTAADEAELVLAGFLAFSDPPREDAAVAIRALQHDGVQIKILTGDNEAVTRHICRQVGLDDSATLTGQDLDGMSDQALAHVAEHTVVFSRLSPQQKNRVILALKSRGHVVGYLGDGINDAPSLHTADAGISVNTAVDVARDAAEIILMELGLGVLHRGILEGRSAFGNVMKYLLMETSSNFGNIFSMAAAAFLLPFLPMLPLQILLNNFLYDLAQLTIPMDRVDSSFLRKPRHWEIRSLRNYMLAIGPISSIFDLLTFAVLLQIMQASESQFQTGWFVESLLTQSLVLFVIRTAHHPWQSRPHPYLVTSVSAVAMAAILLPYAPFAGALGFVPLPLGFYCFVALATAVYLGCVEVVKRWLLGSA
ncbi:MAG TPA: magnesium-translocating P-type ATPase [Planctomycetaceae bacterium]|nr:magnesium-translocating P-type ATPase [Planctomycetaceae bacterium]